MDVSDPEIFNKAADLLEGKLGSIDVWTVNAMVSVFGPLKEMTAEEFNDANGHATIYSGFIKYTDVCNLRGIEIMSPHYKTARNGI